MTKYDDELRASVARGWTESGLSQSDYAQVHGISARTLRSWMSRYASSEPPAERARAAIASAIEGLRNVLAGLEADLARDEGEQPPKSAAAQTGEMKKGNYFSDF